MLKLKSKRISEKDLLAFCNELAAELGGGGKEGLRFGIDSEGGIWLFGKRLQEWKETQEKED